MPSVPAPEAVEAEPHSLLGATLRGTYRIERVLDQGGMGTVFEAEHLRLRRKVAVKVLAQHLARDRQALARFNREAEIISQLQHPHVVQVTDFDTTEAGEPYLVMDLLKGESLQTRLERERCVSLIEAARISYQVASGLAAAHAASVVHRDLKPGNIFLTELAGQGTLVKLLDFGISKRADISQGLTGEYDILGTPEYMAPEQALGRTALVDHRGDQYALAVITYEMLAGGTPFSGRDVMDILRQVINDEPSPIESVAPHVPRAVGEVLRRALSKEPSQRFDTIADFANLLLASAGCSLPPPVDFLAVAQTLPASSTSLPPPAAAERVKSPVRRPTPAEASAVTLAGQFSASDLSTALDRARQAHGLGDLDLAVNNAETALLVAEATDSADAKDRIADARPLIDAIFETRLGPLSRRVLVLPPSSQRKLRVSPEQAFLLSRVDGPVTLDEVIDLSPLPRQKTLRLLVSMLRQGMLTID